MAYFSTRQWYLNLVDEVAGYIDCPEDLHTEQLAHRFLDYFREVSGEDFGCDMQKWREWFDDESNIKIVQGNLHDEAMALVL